MSVPLQNASNKTMKNVLNGGFLTCGIATTFGAYMAYNIVEASVYLPNVDPDLKKLGLNILSCAFNGFIMGAAMGFNHGKLSGSIINPIIGGSTGYLMYKGYETSSELRALVKDFRFNKSGDYIMSKSNQEALKMHQLFNKISSKKSIHDK